MKSGNNFATNWWGGRPITEVQKPPTSYQNHSLALNLLYCVMRISLIEIRRMVSLILEIILRIFM